jgi:hypothetical protein
LAERRRASTTAIFVADLAFRIAGAGALETASEIAALRRPIAAVVSADAKILAVLAAVEAVLTVFRLTLIVQVALEARLDRLVEQPHAEDRNS